MVKTRASMIPGRGTKISHAVWSSQKKKNWKVIENSEFLKVIFPPVYSNLVRQQCRG